ncbi:MAG: VOC family protein [Bacteroidales bacterium]|jgi:PhnB protein|nr:VOC family protein [Bacteroidales bacterium]
MATVNIYLTFNGNCEKAFNFYQSVFGGEFNYVARYNEMPPQEGMPPMSEDDKNRLMHIGLPISKETILMGADNIQNYESHTTFGNNFSIMATGNSKEDADRIFNALAADGRITMAIADQFWGDYMGMLVDKFGISWLVTYELPKG